MGKGICGVAPRYIEWKCAFHPSLPCHGVAVKKVQFETGFYLTFLFFEILRTVALPEWFFFFLFLEKPAKCTVFSFPFRPAFCSLLHDGEVNDMTCALHVNFFTPPHPTPLPLNTPFLHRHTKHLIPSTLRPFGHVIGVRWRS